MKLNKVTLLLILCVSCMVNSQNEKYENLPESIKDNIKTLVGLNKSKNYKALIELGELYKKEQKEYSYVFDEFIIGTYFEFKDFNKVIELSEPYVLNEKALFFKNSAETYLGQAYIMKDRISEGCDVLQKVKSDDSAFIIIYYSNCFESKEYTFSIPGRQSNSKTNLKVEKGDVIGFSADGKVSFGMFTGFSGPEGFKNGAYSNYNRTQEMNHGELFFTVSSDPYLFYELNNLNLIKSSGEVIFHINDKDVRNNSGSFNAILNVYNKPN